MKLKEAKKYQKVFKLNLNKKVIGRYTSEQGENAL